MTSTTPKPPEPFFDHAPDDPDDMIYSGAMITGVPEPSQLSDAGLDYLCLAWVELHRLVWQAQQYSGLEAELSKGE